MSIRARISTDRNLYRFEFSKSESGTSVSLSVFKIWERYQVRVFKIWDRHNCRRMDMNVYRYELSNSGKYTKVTQRACMCIGPSCLNLEPIQWSPHGRNVYRYELFKSGSDTMANERTYLGDISQFLLSLY